MPTSVICQTLQSRRCSTNWPQELGAPLGQERIYVAFADRTWILDASEQARGA